MGKNKLLWILQWGWEGIKVWSVLISLGVPAVIRAIFHTIFSGWAWYDQLLLFVGIGLIVLGILAAIFGGKKIKSPVSQLAITDEQKEVLDYYERQKENWNSNLRLRITNVKPALDAAVPKVTFEFEVTNFLPIEVKLTKVVDSSGTVNAFGFGLCELPAFKGETIDKTVRKCDTLPFSLTMEVGKTRLPEFLQPKLTEGGQGFQWILLAKWYIEIEKKPEEWNLGDLLYNQVIAKQ